MNSATSFKPHVEPDARMGYVCKGLDIEAHGMTAEAAYASWEHRFMQRQVVPAVDYQARNDETVRRLEAELVPTSRCPDSVQPDLGIPFCYEPL